MDLSQAKELLENRGDYLEDAKGKKDSLQIVSGLEVLHKYTNKDFNFSAEHDVIYLCEYNEETTEEDLIKLSRLGFHLDEELEVWAMYV